MKYAKSLGLDVSINTNGRRLTPELIDQLLEVEPTYIRVSLNAGSPEVEKITTGVDDFELIIQNIKTLLEKKWLKHSSVDVSIGYVVNVVNVNDIMSLVRRLRNIEKELEYKYGNEQFLYTVQIRPVSNYESSKQYNMKNIQAVIEYLRTNFDDSYVEEFNKFMFEDTQCSARTLKLALDIITNQAMPFLAQEKSRISIIYPQEKYLDIALIKNKPYPQCDVCPWFAFIWTDGTVYPCVEWAGSPGFEIGNIFNESLKDIVEGQDRRRVIELINNDVLNTRCAPICAHHEMNILLNGFHNKTSEDIKAELEAIKNMSNTKPPHINFLILPKNINRVKKWLANGQPVWLAALKIALKRIYAFLMPIAFVNEHGYTSQEAKKMKWYVLVNSYVPTIIGSAVAFFGYDLSFLLSFAIRSCIRYNFRRHFPLNMGH